MAKKKIGALLEEKGYINEFQLVAALSHQRKWKSKLGQSLIELGYLEEDQLYEVLAEQLGMELVNLRKTEISLDILKKVTKSFAREWMAIPISFEADTWTVATSEPDKQGLVENLAECLKGKVKLVLATPMALETKFRKIPDKFQVGAVQPVKKAFIRDENGDIQPLGGPDFKDDFKALNGIMDSDVAGPAGQEPQYPQGTPVEETDWMQQPAELAPMEPEPQVPEDAFELPPQEPISAPQTEEVQLPGMEDETGMIEESIEAPPLDQPSAEAPPEQPPPEPAPEPMQAPPPAEAEPPQPQVEVPPEPAPEPMQAPPPAEAAPPQPPSAEDAIEMPPDEGPLPLEPAYETAAQMETPDQVQEPPMEMPAADDVSAGLAPPPSMDEPIGMPGADEMLEPPQEEPVPFEPAPESQAFDTGQELPPPAEGGFDPDELLPPPLGEPDAAEAAGQPPSGPENGEFEDMETLEAPSLDATDLPPDEAIGLPPAEETPPAAPAPDDASPDEIIEDSIPTTPEDNGIEEAAPSGGPTLDIPSLDDILGPSSPDQPQQDLGQVPAPEVQAPPLDEITLPAGQEPGQAILQAPETPPDLMEEVTVPPLEPPSTEAPSLEAPPIAPPASSDSPAAEDEDTVEIMNRISTLENQIESLTGVLTQLKDMVKDKKK